MRKLRIGVVVRPGMLPTAGGGYSYYSSLLHGINTYYFDPRIEIVNVVFRTEESQVVNFPNEIVYIDESKAALKKNKLRKLLPGSWFKALKQSRIVYDLYHTAHKKGQPAAQSILQSHRIDILYYLTPEYNILDHPFIMTTWDLGHRSCQAFPEFVMNGEYESREAFYSTCINKALLILSESEAGAAELKQYYAFNDNKIKVLPIFGNRALAEQADEATQAAVLRHFQLSRQGYFIYPAQFWAHKNHFNLVWAFKAFLESNARPDVKLVLCGSDQGNQSYIETVVRELDLEAYVHFTGFVTDTELHCLYRNAISLVMPTFLGPTNMPLIEAAGLDCPVLCSDIAGHREIMADCAFYFDPASHQEISLAMNRIYKLDKREEWIERARKHIDASPFKLESSLHLLNTFFKELYPIRTAWA
jgi:glycosyltransferase involved in cell wall biosynthesis